MRVSIKQIVTIFKRTHRVTETAKQLGISRWTVSRWLKRARGLTGNLRWTTIHRRSTRPKRIHHKVGGQLEAEVVKLAQQTHTGARKLKYHLRTNVSARTIHRILLAKGLVRKQINYRRPLFQNGACMRPANTHDLGFVQMDTKHVTPELSGLPFTVYEYAGIDILSRYKVAVLLPEISDESASLALEFFLKWFPFAIEYIQTDNGLEFQRSFQLACQKHNIDHYFIHKNSPNENAVIERSFKTDQEEFYYWLEKQPEHISELNSWLQQFINQYNTFRPHQALDYKTPQEVVNLYLNQM